MALSKKDRAIALATKICDALDPDQFDRMTLGEIESVIDDLRTLRSLLGHCSFVNFAQHYLERMKRPRANKQAEGQRAKDAAVRAKVMAQSMEE